MVASDHELRDAILAANRGFMDAIGRGDAKGIAVLYTTSGQLLPTHCDFVTGQQAIQEFWQGVMEMGIKTVQLVTVEVEGHGDTAIEVGTYTLGGAEGRVLDEGKYVVIWKQEGGKWRLHRDIWNSSLPAPG